MGLQRPSGWLALLPPTAQTNSGRLGTFRSCRGNIDQEIRCHAERTGYIRLSQKVPREIDIHTETATGSRSSLYHPIASLSRGPALPGECSRVGVSVKRLHSMGREGWMKGWQHDDKGPRTRQSCNRQSCNNLPFCHSIQAFQLPLPRSAATRASAEALS